MRQKHPSEELCDDKLLTTVDGFSTLNDCTGSNRTHLCWACMQLNQAIEYCGLNSDASDTTLRHANHQGDENTCATMAPNMNVQSNACAKVLWSRFSWVLKMVVNLAVGMRGPPTPIVTVMVMFLLCGQIAHPCGQRRGPIPLRWHQHARVEPGVPSAPTNQARR